MSTSDEFHYRLPHRVGGHRPGAHPGSAVGAGQEFVVHRRLVDAPDPRRLDIRASLRSVTGDWLVRGFRQRTGITVQLIVDVSASMTFGLPRSKLSVAADFAAALGASTFRLGDALGMQAFDARAREDLFVPARRGRGTGLQMAASLRACASAARAGGVAGLKDVVLRLTSRPGLVFLVSDFHWPLDELTAVLEGLGAAYTVPLVVWDAAEIEPPRQDGPVPVMDVESGARRTLWLRRGLREQWRDSVAARRTALDGLFLRHAIRPLYVSGAIDGAALSRYFLEAGS